MEEGITPLVWSTIAQYGITNASERGRLRNSQSLGD